MNRRSLFRSLVGLPLLPLAAKAVEAAPVKPTPKIFTTGGAYTVPVPGDEAVHYVSCSGGGGASGTMSSAFVGHGGAGGMYSTGMSGGQTFTITVGGGAA